MFNFIKKIFKEKEIVEFIYYVKSFDTNCPPPYPPLREIRDFFGETKESKRRMREWNLRLKEWDEINIPKFVDVLKLSRKLKEEGIKNLAKFYKKNI